MDFKERASELLNKHLAEWESDPTRLESAYDCEASYAKMMQKFEKELSQASLGKVSKSKNAKKVHTWFGKIEQGKNKPGGRALLVLDAIRNKIIQGTAGPVAYEKQWKKSTAKAA